MTKPITNFETKPSFWKRIWIVLQEVEKSSVERQWDTLDAIRVENLSLKKRVVQLEAAMQRH